MGDHPHITHDSIPEQGTFQGRRVSVCFRYNTEHLVYGTIVRDDIEDPGILIIMLDSGFPVLSTECQYQPIPPDEPQVQAGYCYICHRVILDNQHRVMLGNGWVHYGCHHTHVKLTKLTIKK